MIAALRILMILAVAAGVLLPKVSAAMAGAGLSGGAQIVICSGRGLAIVTIGPDGAPAPDAAREDPCSLIHALVGDAVGPGVGAPARQALPADMSRPDAWAHRAAPRAAGNAPRAPPQG